MFSLGFASSGRANPSDRSTENRRDHMRLGPKYGRPIPPMQRRGDTDPEPCPFRDGVVFVGAIIVPGTMLATATALRRTHSSARRHLTQAARARTWARVSTTQSTRMLDAHFPQ